MGWDLNWPSAKWRENILHPSVHITYFTNVVDFLQALHIEEHQVSQENRLVKELELLKDELAPLEERRKFLAQMVILRLDVKNYSPSSYGKVT